ncbi:MAG: BON domain-containing protein [Cocleimonas sp.]
MPHSHSKSPAILLLLLATLIISTLVALSHYFIRPSLEFNLKLKITQSLAKQDLQKTSFLINGRDVVVHGQVKEKQEAQRIKKIIENVSGVRQVTSELVIKNQTVE